jgi:hypothetical protein
MPTCRRHTVAAGEFHITANEASSRHPTCLVPMCSFTGQISCPAQFEPKASTRCDPTSWSVQTAHVALTADNRAKEHTVLCTRRYGVGCRMWQ